MTRLLRRWPLVRRATALDLTARGHTAYFERTEQAGAPISVATAYASVCPCCATGCARADDVNDGRSEAIEGTEGRRSPAAGSVPRARHLLLGATAIPVPNPLAHTGEGPA